MRIAAFIVATLVVGCSFYVIFSYAFAFIGQRRPQARLLRAGLVELLSTLVMLPLWPLWLIVGASYQATQEGVHEPGEGPNPVILLHGLAMNRTNWFWLGRRLASRGIGPLYATTYFSPQAVRHSALHLRAYVEHVLAIENAKRVDIVAHSLGGVVARYYIERLGGDRRVTRLITIASPHRGTLLARIGLVPSAREISAGSIFLADLGGFHPHVAYTSIWSHADALIDPPDSARIAPEGEDRVFDDLGHLSLLLSPRVLDAVAERLRA